MTTRTVHRYRIDARIEGEIEYDSSKPESYTAALAEVQVKRKGVVDLGADITLDKGGPVAVRGE